MASLHNIDKSAFRHGEYVGYALGVWRIRKSSSAFGRWCATHRDNLRAPTLYAFTLGALSAKLSEYEAANIDEWKAARAAAIALEVRP